MIVDGGLHKQSLPERTVEKVMPEALPQLRHPQTAQTSLWLLATAMETWPAPEPRALPGLMASAVETWPMPKPWEGVLRSGPKAPLLKSSAQFHGARCWKPRTLPCGMACRE